MDSVVRWNALSLFCFRETQGTPVPVESARFVGVFVVRRAATSSRSWVVSRIFYFALCLWRERSM